MPNDAKLGLVVGVGLVIVVAVVFFRKEVPSVDTAATIVQPAPVPTPLPAPALGHNALAKPTGRVPEMVTGARRHTVCEGDTLSSLAQRYYGDGEKSTFIFKVNRNRLISPEDIPPGTVLVIPEVPDE